MAVVELKNVVKKYGRINALDGVSLEIEQGSCVGLIGVNGAGKSTLMKLITGIILRDSGDANVLGWDPGRRRPEMLARIGLISESPSLYPFLTGREHLKLIQNVKAGISDGDVDAILEKVGLAGRENDKVSGYSFGMRQRLGMAQALIGNPELLLLDEPTNGLDPVGVRDLRSIVSDFRGKSGSTVLISSHNLHEVGLMCDSYIFINKGKIVDVTKREELGDDLESEFFKRIEGT
ncbi:MAG: ABC transporter ATP-binding protein [Clostridia bacterium]|nr:ABC transporter ATP-binding protein [Clostridia bacterium]